MIIVERYQTYDGVVHKSWERATRHLQDRYAILMGEVQGGTTGGRKQVKEWIDDNLDTFAKMQEIKRDMTTKDS